MTTWQQIAKVDQSIGEAVGKGAIPLLRLSLALVYIWFGALKLAGVSPVASLVAQTAHPVPKKIAVPLMGLWELVIGLGLLLRLALRPTLLLLFLQITGTFMTAIRRPQRIFQANNPLLLTKEGEFLLKNLVLLSAGLAVAGSSKTEESEEDAAPSLW